MSKHKPYNYSKSQEPTPVAEEVVVEEVVTPEPKEVVGVVKECAKLNVRTHPSMLASIITEIKVGTKVVINETESAEDFYKVCTETGVEGFCMKKFVAVEQ